MRRKKRTNTGMHSPATNRSLLSQNASTYLDADGNALTGTTATIGSLPMPFPNIINRVPISFLCQFSVSHCQGLVRQEDYWADSTRALRQVDSGGTSYHVAHLALQTSSTRRLLTPYHRSYRDCQDYKEPVDRFIEGLQGQPAAPKLPPLHHHRHLGHCCRPPAGLTYSSFIRVVSGLWTRWPISQRDPRVSLTQPPLFRTKWLSLEFLALPTQYTAVPVTRVQEA